MPVYLLIIAAFIPDRPLLGRLFSAADRGHAGPLRFLVSWRPSVTARILKSSILKSGRTPFLLEMPSYRWPTWKSIGLRLVDRGKVFLRRVGTVILVVTAILFVLTKLPLVHGAAPPIEDSLAGTIGRTIEPVIRPLGFNWKIGIGLITSLASRETIISSLGSIYGMDESNKAGLREALRRDLTPGGALALLIFFAFAMQCISTIAVVRRETGGWKWPALQFAYMSVLAYTGAFLAFHIVG